ncbi:alpha-ketoglutarate-dependent dioxygenase alkB homolog 7, mitochondrial-like [Antedon mediterranea]|uniref:alpha-ketoglutarate-dependent dioxygenase alkB homolog 7, mitochondrial-like n=1 Tax=Antedon mediterranea TaxID=105859 RepID=UPI003AF667C3
MTIYKCFWRSQKHLFTCQFLGQRRTCVGGGRSRLTAATTFTLLGREPRPCPSSFIPVRFLTISSRPTHTVPSTMNITNECTEFSGKDARDIFEKDFKLYNEFISEIESETLMKEVQKYFKGLRYEVDHWDDAIHGYRETEKSNWNEDNSRIIQKVRETAFTKSASSQLNLVHVLDLAEDGYIKPHVDSVKFCGNVIAGISLLSPSVMRLVHVEQKNIWANVLLRPLSLYVLQNRVRYEFTHEILSNETSSYLGNKVQKSRRISVICRNTAE